MGELHVDTFAWAPTLSSDIKLIKCLHRSRFMNLWTFPTEDDREVKLCISMQHYVTLISFSSCR